MAEGSGARSSCSTWSGATGRAASWPAPRWDRSSLPNDRLRVLLNPRGGDGRAERRWRRVEPVARRLFPDLTVARSTGPDHLRQLATEAAGSEGLVLAAGGDGTSHEVVNGFLAGHSAPLAMLGWLPLGSGNDIARANRVPLDPALALPWYREAVRTRIDVGRVRYRTLEGAPAERLFGNSFTLGITTHVLATVSAQGKPMGGRASYFLAGLHGLATHRPLRVGIDGRESSYRLVSVTNGPTFGAGMRVSPSAQVDDGALDLITVDALSRPATALLFPRIYWGGHLRHPAVHHRLVETVRLEAAGPMPFEADGELLAGIPPFEITVLPGALPVAGAPPTKPDPTR